MARFPRVQQAKPLSRAPPEGPPAFTRHDHAQFPVAIRNQFIAGKPAIGLTALIFHVYSAGSLDSPKAKPYFHGI
jgi:hypothetical protein